MSFTDQLWNSIEPVYDRILNMPFNKEMAEGTLSEEIFTFYLKQDSYYLSDFTRALSLTGIRNRNMKYAESYLEFALGAVKVERALHESYFEKFEVPEDIEKSPTCFNYTNYLLRTAALDSVAVSVAAVLPCFWIYREVGHHIYNHSVDDNPYEEWIDTYSSKQFSEDVDQAIEITDRIASQVTEQERDRMAEAFGYATRLEWMFWDSAYRLEQWPPRDKES